jgi:hypothetical protein
MNNPNPELVILPFTAKLKATTVLLTFDQLMFLLRKGRRSQIQIERSYPGSPQAIGWTIFRRTPRKYLYENEPFFRFERGARRYIRKAYALHYALNRDEGLTHSHLYL